MCQPCLFFFFIPFRSLFAFYLRSFCLRFSPLARTHYLSLPFFKSPSSSLSHTRFPPSPPFSSPLPYSIDARFWVEFFCRNRWLLWRHSRWPTTRKCVCVTGIFFFPLWSGGWGIRREIRSAWGALTRFACRTEEKFRPFLFLHCRRWCCNHECYGCFILVQHFFIDFAIDDCIYKYHFTSNFHFLYMVNSLPEVWQIWLYKCSKGSAAQLKLIACT